MAGRENATRQEIGLKEARAPLALAAVVFSVGIWLADHLARPPVLWSVGAFALVLCAVAALIVKNLRLAQLSSVLALLCAGAFARVYIPAPRVIVPPSEFLSGDPVEIEGHVTSDGALLPGNAPRERFDVQTEIIRAGERTFTSPVGIRATVFSREWNEDQAEAMVALPPLKYGDRVRFTARLRLPRNFRNPGAFDYEGYLHGLRIGVMASVDAQKIDLLPGKAGTRLGFWRSRIRRSILEHMNGGNQKTGLWDPPDGALFAAMILGDDSMLLRGVREEFQQTGVYHLLVGSRPNMALL